MVLRKSLLATSIVVATLGLTACGGSSSSSNDSNNNGDNGTVTTPTNSAPTAIALTAQAQVNENVAGQVIGTLAATDADSDETFTFTTADERFLIDATSLVLKPSVILNFEAEPQVSVDVTVTDSANNTFSAAVTFDVTDAKDYDFLNAESGDSSVSYSGQIARHALIKELYNYIGGDLATDAQTMTADALLAQLNKFYKISDGDYDAIANAMSLSIVQDAKQATLADISGSHKDLSGKIAGNDATGQHKDWNDGASFEGWAGLEINTPEGLMNALIAQVVERVQQTTVQTPNGKEIETHYVTAEGVDLKQLTQKFLYGAVAFSQGADDYLDDATQGKGLKTSNILDDKAYTNLEHQWDEGFGYFGAARNYLSYTDEEVAAKGGRENWQGNNDFNADGKIDLNAEYNFGNSTNAAKRDLGSKDYDAKTDYSADAFNAFFAGRKLISDNVGTELTDEQLTELKGYAVAATAAWEKSISATVVHYINDTIADLEQMKVGTYEADKFVTLAKHWSEMKGFALNLQFNPESPFNAEANAGKFAQMHVLMGNKPVVGEQADVEAYIVELKQARDILQQVYSFDGEVVTNW
ncbi:hypothetical protein PSECIP111951_02209 [Pseudoalteromonas holothuriae]|uniref:DUF4856 domain-containing protein n=1 Tax=Pseudoalteromonas holothuriae TaxID=2963714 RepID=A0A9W4QSP8_9GAMM|nr:MULTISPECIES: DUF4856 domain-containing protein [unclassified Pseudoalteromonas]CAH9051064.1 hypothetical protein PSECIP111854_00661 [Pseudoalteromonas sp. CIP111854]CAH9060129.1 hypothetical protein PSECIP111951_02209 [Pseudoalteromonas sp. CIP111951]